MTQPPWSARSQPVGDLIPPARPPSREIGPDRRANGLAILLLLLAGLVLRLAIAYILFPGQGLDNDLKLPGDWAQTLADHGPGGFYANVGWTDYTPGYLYVLWLLGVLGNALASPLGMPAADVIQGLLKLPAILADVALAGLLYRAASRWHSRRAGLIAAGLFLFIPVTWYDSAMWGQVDAVGALLLVAVALLLIDGWDEPATGLAVLAAVVKPQFAIGLLIVAGVIAGRYLLGRLPETTVATNGFGAALDRRLGGWFTLQHGVRRLVACIVTGVVTFVVLILPFDLQTLANPGVAGTPVLGQVAGFMALVSNAAARYNVLTVNAYNAWAVVGPTPLSQIMSGNVLFWTYDTQSVLGVQASTIGAVLFAAIALMVVTALAWRNDRTAIVLGMTVLAVAFFAVPTRVHERYLFPAFGIGALLAAASVGWRWWYLVLGLASTVNLHAVLTLPNPGYGTSAMRSLPLGAELRSEAAVWIVAIVVTAAFLIVLAAFALRVARPALAESRAGLMSGYLASHRPASAMATAPTPEEEYWGWGDRPRLGARISKRSIGRTELGLAALLVVLTFGFRVQQLGMPRGMYFDEIYYAGTGAEFLQDWRYGMPHELTENTHPPLGKYFVAGSIALAGNNRVTSTETLPWTVTGAAFEPTYVDPSAADGRSGDRIILATGSGVVVAEQGRLDKATNLSLAGARTVTVDTNAHRIFVGTSGGGIWQYTSASLEALAAHGTAPVPIRIASIGSEVTNLRPIGYSNLIAQSGGTLSLIDLATGNVTWRLTLPAVTDIETYNIDGRWVALAATPDGLLQLDPADLTPISQVRLVGGVQGLDLVYGSPQQKQWRDLLATPTLYVATGAARMELLTFGADGKLVDWGGFAMPGPVTGVAWNRATNLVHVLGKTRDGNNTVYVVEPNSNSTFADAELAFSPAAWIVDAQPNDPGSDRERVIAFSGAGTYSSIDAGSNAFAWRLPAVLAGALLAGLLFLLAMVLFRRRSVGLIFAALISLDGLIFGRSRIAGVDVYLALFIVAALLALAYFLQSRASGKRALLQGLLLPPLIGVLLGLAVATKWPGLYAIGAAVLIILLRSVPGRWLALAGMVGLTGFLGYLALDSRPPNSLFALLMLGLTVLMAVGIVRAGPPNDDEPRWTDPRWRRGLPFAWTMACLILVPAAIYVASYIPWALSAGGSPQLFAGWPPGHTGQTFWDLQAQMYRLHNEYRYGHGASSPWWAWPFDLKPVWAYLENMLGGSQAAVIEAGNPILFWLGIPAAAFGMWRAWSRREHALGFVAIAALALWLPWARIDRNIFDYHFYPSLLFVLLLLAYFLAELWDGASVWTWRLARGGVALALLAPALLWIASGPLCFASGVPASNYWTVCQAGTAAWPAWTLPWLGAGIAISIVAWRFIRPRQLVVAVLVGAAVAFAVMYPALSAWQLPDGMPGRYSEFLPSWSSTFIFGHNDLPAANTPLMSLGLLMAMAFTVALVATVVALASGWRPRIPARLSRGGGSDRDRAATATATATATACEVRPYASRR